MSTATDPSGPPTDGATALVDALVAEGWHATVRRPIPGQDYSLYELTTPDDMLTVTTGDYSTGRFSPW